MLSNRKIVVVGAGPAGCASAVQCKRLGIDVLLLDRTGVPGGLVKNAYSLENYPGLTPQNGIVFATKLKDHLVRFSIQVQKGEVERLESADCGFVLWGDFDRIYARSVIIAVGTAAIPLRLPGAAEAAGCGLFYEVIEALSFLRNRKEGQAGLRVLVVGGGEAALDYSLSLARFGATVTILVRGQTLRAAGRLINMVENNPAINIIYEACLDSMRVIDNMVEVDILNGRGKSKKTYHAVVAAIGRVSRAGDLSEELDPDLLKDVSTQIPGLFVVGDARLNALGQVGIVVGDGLKAAMEAVNFLEMKKQC